MAALDIRESIVRVLQESDRAMTALEMANEIATSRKEVSSVKKEINKTIFNMGEVERRDVNEKPPKWQLKTTAAMVTNIGRCNLATDAPRPNVSLSTEKCVLPGLPTLEPAFTNSPPPAAHSFSSQRPSEILSDSPQASLQPVTPTRSLEEEILRVLTGSESSMSAVSIAKAVGKVSAKDVNPTLYRLKKEGKVRQEPSNTSKKLWKAVSTSPSNDSITSGATPVRQYQQIGVNVAPPPNTAPPTGVAPPPGTAPPTGVAPPPGIGVDDLFKKTDLEGGHILFSKVNALASNEPTVTPISETPPAPQAHYPVEESSGAPVQASQPSRPSQPSQPSQPSAQLGSHDGVSRPIQVDVDDRQQQSVEPVSPPDTRNFKDRPKTFEKDGKGLAGATKTEKMSSLLIEANNLSCKEPPSTETTSSQTLPSSQSSAPLESTLSSLSSLSLELASSGSGEHTSLDTSGAVGGTPDKEERGATAAEGEGANDVAGSGKEGAKKRKKGKKKLAIKFPSENGPKEK